MAMEAERTARRTEALSRERIIAASIDILDSRGESALTFRALATLLSTGPGAIYWHVPNKEELLAAAANTLIARAIGALRVDGQVDDGPRVEIRAIAMGLFDTIEAHPWIGSQLSREPGQLGNTQVFEAVGSRLHALGVEQDAQFDAASALTNYISGSASQNAAHARNVPRDMDRSTFLDLTAARWAGLDPIAYPFVHRMLAQLPNHDDREQFLAGIDMILAGIAAIRG